MIMKKLLALLFALILGLSLAACGGTEEKPVEDDAAGTEASAEGITIKVAATPAPHAEILEVAKEILAEDGITLEIVVFTDYVQPNDATESGNVDANYFQHITYLEKENAERGMNLVSVAPLHYEPFGLYPGKTATIEDLPDGAKIAVPSDNTNGARALLLLEAEGLFTLEEGIGMAATKYDIAENPKNIEIVDMEAASLVGALASVDMAVINGNYAIDAGLVVAEDAVAVEASDSDAAELYANVLVVKEGNENSAGILALIEALQSDRVREYIETTYEGAVVPLF